MREELRAPGLRPWRELGAGQELFRLSLAWRSLKREPRGDARVLVAPGFLTGDASTWPLRRVLSRLGHEVFGWGLGRNRGNSLLPQLKERVQELAKEGPLHLIGWSLGGMMVREVARELPEHVEQVFTMGSPLIGGPKYTVFAKYYRERVGLDLDDIERQIEAREQTPIQVPVVSIYSRRDSIVCPAASQDKFTSDTEHIEVSCCHMGLGWSPEVVRILARRLASPSRREER